jgi:hypothetical protein
MAIATISLQGTIDGKTQTVSKSATIDDAVMPYFLACYRAAYGQVPDTVADPDGTKRIMRGMTDAETFAAYADGISAGTLGNVRTYLKDRARQAAEAAIPNITMEAK